MKGANRRSAAALAGAALAAAALGSSTLGPARTAGASEAGVPTFAARYEVEYKGHRVGREELSVRYDAARQRYRFESRTQAVGLLKLARPRASVQRTDFVLHDGKIRPLEFWFEDGTRKGEDDRHIVFDWAHDKATVTRDSQTSELALEPRMLDAGTILVAIMLDLASNETPGPYKYTDGKSPSTYSYTNEGGTTLDVEAGRFDTTMLDQHHEGSSRRTRFYVASKLDYLPVKIAQYKDDELLTALTLESVEGLDGGGGQSARQR